MQPYYGATTTTSSEIFCAQQNQSMQSNENAVNMQYWNQTTTSTPQSHQPLTEQHSPNHLNYSNGSSYASTAEPVYQAFQSAGTNVYSPNAHTNFNGGTAHANGHSLSTQDLYQYSPYSGDLLQPEDIFQMDQPIRSANASSLNDLSTSPPATLLDLGSGTIGPKPLSSYSDVSESYYSLHDDNSTTSSHNTDTNCYYSSVGEQMHPNSLNNSSAASMVAVSAASTSPFESTPYYCDTRSDTLARQYERHTSPIEAATEYSSAAYANNNNNNNSNSTNNNNNNAINNNNIHGNFKSHKRKATEAFADSNSFLTTFDASAVASHEYYGNSVEHLSNNLTNLELQQQNHSFGSHYGNNCSPMISEYCNEAISSHPHSNHCMTYYDNETNNMIQLTANSYEISAVGTN